MEPLGEERRVFCTFAPMMHYPIFLLSLLGSVLWAQIKAPRLEEPQQSWVFHVEGDLSRLSVISAELPPRFSQVRGAYPCERGGYLVILPTQPLPTARYEEVQAALTAFLQEQGLTVYPKSSAAVMELAQVCDQLLKALLHP